MVAKKQRIKKTSRQNLFFSVLLGSAILIIVGYLVVSNLMINQKRAELEYQRRVLEEKIQELELKRQGLEAQISQTLEEDYLEKEAREKLNLKKPGEEVVAVLPSEEEEKKAEERGFWEKILDKIKFW